MLNILPSAQAFCTGKQLSEVIGVTPRQIERLAEQRVLRLARGKAGARLYCLADAVQNFLAYQRAYVTEQIKGSDEVYTSARARRMLAMAEVAELELQVKKGELHHSEDIEHCFGMVLTSTRDKLLGVPSKVMHSLVGPTNATTAYQIVSDAIRLAFTDLAKVPDFRAESEAFLLAQESSANSQTADGAEL